MARRRLIGFPLWRPPMLLPSQLLPSVTVLHRPGRQAQWPQPHPRSGGLGRWPGWTGTRWRQSSEPPRGGLARRKSYSPSGDDGWSNLGHWSSKLPRSQCCSRQPAWGDGDNGRMTDLCIKNNLTYNYFGILGIVSKVAERRLGKGDMLLTAPEWREIGTNEALATMWAVGMCVRLRVTKLSVGRWEWNAERSVKGTRAGWSPSRSAAMHKARLAAHALAIPLCASISRAYLGLSPETIVVAFR